jgi:hypothetical protein
VSGNQEILRSLKVHLTSSVLQDEVLASYSSEALVKECKLLSSHITHQLDSLLAETTQESDENETFLTELTEIKDLLESPQQSLPHSLEELFHRHLLSLPEEFYMKEYKTVKPKDIGMNLLMNYTKSYIEEHGSLYEGTGGTD